MARATGVPSLSIRTAEEGEVVAPTSTEPAAGPTAEPVRVLLVDDEVELRDLFRRYLERGGCSVVAEADRTEGLVELAAQCAPDAILLDLRLGAESGADAIGPLSRALPTSMIAILTSLDAEDEESAVKRAGAFAFYEKTMLTDLTRYLHDDLANFRRALAGEDVLAPSAVARR